jgi:hypothetical protein
MLTPVVESTGIFLTANDDGDGAFLVWIMRFFFVFFFFYVTFFWSGSRIKPTANLLNSLHNPLKMIDFNKHKHFFNFEGLISKIM